MYEAFFPSHPHAVYPRLAARAVADHPGHGGGRGAAGLRRAGTALRRAHRRRRRRQIHRAARLPGPLARHPLHPALCDRLAAHPAQLLPRGALATRPARRASTAATPAGNCTARSRSATTPANNRSSSSTKPHLLGRAMLEEVRFLLNFDVDSRAPLALILAGQPELRRTLKLECFTAIAQRISSAPISPALTPEESAGYIQHHLTQAGATGPLFTEPALPPDPRLHRRAAAPTQ